MIGNRGLRHLALRVTNVARAVEFYSRVFGMRVVWQPDADNAYLSSGSDNLALHRGKTGKPNRQSLDHLGFIVATIEEVEQAYQWALTTGVEMAKALERHRDGSVSFYIFDPDQNLVQVLYEPSISPLRFT